MKPSRALRVALLIFAKYPTPGSVKTRMQSGITPDQAADVHTACLLSTLARTALRPRGVEPILLSTPDGESARWDSLLRTHDLQVPRWPQGDGDLGRRLDRAFRRAFDAGFRMVLAIGADSPTLWPARIGDGVDALDKTDLALGPTEDGGYYLIGLRRPAPAVFADVEWGTDRVAGQTLDAARNAGLRAELLPLGYDLDRPEDLARLMAELDQRTDDPRDRDLLSALRRAVADRGN